MKHLSISEANPDVVDSWSMQEQQILPGEKY
jgi:hypothetical protein